MKKICIVFFVLVLSILMMSCTNEGTAGSTTNAGLDQTPETTDGADTSPAVSEQILYDENSILIKTTSLPVDGSTGAEVGLYIENNGDLEIGIRVIDASINGYMITPLIDANVLPGNHTDTILSFPTEELSACGIDTVTDITFSLCIYDAGIYENLYQTDPITIPITAVEAYTQVYDDSGDVLLDDAGVKIVYKEMVAASLSGPSYRLYIENNTDKRISIQTRDVFVNGTSIRPAFICYLTPGKAAVCSIDFLSSDFAGKDIVDVSEIELEFVVFDTDTFDDIVISETVVIHP